VKLYIAIIYIIKNYIKNRAVILEPSTELMEERVYFE